MQVVRILLYEGSEDFVKNSLAYRTVRSVHHGGPGNCIKEAILGNLEDLLLKGDHGFCIKPSNPNFTDSKEDQE